MMRLNKFLALYTDLSRRSADQAIEDGRVSINDRKITKGIPVDPSDKVTLDNLPVVSEVTLQTIMLNKPFGFVCIRDGQVSPTVYELLPPDFRNLNPVGRLDKDSSGLLLLTNNGDLAQKLTHPSYKKNKIYDVAIDKPLEPLHHQMINDHGIILKDGRSKLILQKIDENSKTWTVTMHEGRNRQIRRTFESLGYKVTKLHRTQFGDYNLNDLRSGGYIEIKD